jgi:hypothetical protein
VSVRYQRSEFGPFLAHTIGSFEPGAARRYMSDVSVAASCGTWDQYDESGNLENYTIARVDAPNVGEESAHYLVDVRTTAATAQLDIFLSRRGDIVNLVTHLGFPTVDQEATLREARLADQKVARVLR